MQICTIQGKLSRIIYPTFKKARQKYQYSNSNLRSCFVQPPWKMGTEQNFLDYETEINTTAIQKQEERTLKLIAAPWKEENPVWWIRWRSRQHELYNNSWQLVYFKTLRIKNCSGTASCNKGPKFQIQFCQMFRSHGSYLLSKETSSALT